MMLHRAKTRGLGLAQRRQGAEKRRKNGSGFSSVNPRVEGTGGLPQV